MNRWLCDLAEEAGRIALDFLRDGFETKTKPDGSLVTSADLRLDQFIQEQIRARYPKDCVLSEESPDDPDRLNARRVWLVDPIDGTTHFASRRPDFGVLITRCEDGEAVECVAHFPALWVTLYASAEAGAFVNGRPVKVSAHDFEGARIVCTVEGASALNTAPTAQRNNAMAIFRVVTGEIDACALQTSPSAGEHDYAWASCAAAAAGGMFTDLAGATLKYNKARRSMPRVLVCSNGVIHERLLRELADAIDGSSCVQEGPRRTGA
jgi:myo-inositol-1(or 4)-monophosphatase